MNRKTLLGDSMDKSFTFNADGTKTVTEVDFLADIETVDSQTSQQFFAEVGKKAAANYIARHSITRPPKDDEEALRWAREATAASTTESTRLEITFLCSNRLLRRARLAANTDIA